MPSCTDVEKRGVYRFAENQHGNQQTLYDQFIDFVQVFLQILTGVKKRF